MNLERGFRRLVVVSSFLVLAVGLSIAGYKFYLRHDYLLAQAEYDRLLSSTPRSASQKTSPSPAVKPDPIANPGYNPFQLDPQKIQAHDEEMRRGPFRILALTAVSFAALWAIFYVVRWIVVGFAGGR